MACSDSILLVSSPLAFKIVVTTFMVDVLSVWLLTLVLIETLAEVAFTSGVVMLVPH